MLLDLIAHPHWFWLTLGGLLLAAEMLGTSGYLLWSGVAAVLVGLVEWVFPLSWAVQGSLFAVLMLLSLYLWYRWMQRDQKSQPVVSSLNQRGHQLIGFRLTLETALVNGIGHVRIGDSSWRVQATTSLPAGTEVMVTGIDGITLRIIPVTPAQ
ncbi:NfeD family protein [Candidatus Pantoea multigeneris]|uniref:NfeD family protein n=1 Tax=Candidatus Pantoea multigeneris TaxID=2608357 RepID=A0ABX0RCK6_9GAMM|nr:NfeD family protein [Pantoea multigeneris]NIF23090.1 NfeD family protein [Pantoea multigeneris]